MRSGRNLEAADGPSLLIMPFRFSLAAVLTYRESLEHREYIVLEQIQQEITRTERTSGGGRGVAGNRGSTAGHTTFSRPSLRAPAASLRT